MLVTRERGMAAEIPPGASHAGIAIAPQRPPQYRTNGARLDALARHLTAEEMANQIEYL
ncbi:MAG: hypothetical protein IT427_16875 [Pirellulales bacterium]|nr:hypothetical protein [Pirellulales bacterium]